MSGQVLAGLAVGITYAAADWWLLRYVAKKAASDPERSGSLLGAGLAARYLFTIAVLAAALLIPGIDAVWVIIPLIAQKVLIVISALIPKEK